eukprot:m.10336 g.10336  ORF g.10336 m.10336 type:complete len:126 (+) comp5548_c0_seq1:6021-6398(+)
MSSPKTEAKSVTVCRKSTFACCASVFARRLQQSLTQHDTVLCLLGDWVTIPQSVSVDDEGACVRFDGVQDLSLASKNNGKGNVGAGSGRLVDSNRIKAALNRSITKLMSPIKLTLSLQHKRKGAI